MTRKLLFLGCNHAQIPYLEALKKREYMVIGVDMNETAPGKYLCDRFYKAGYDDFESLIRIGDKENFSSEDKVFTAAAQFAQKGAAHFADAFGIPYPPEIMIDVCLDKSAYYLDFLKRNTPIPETWFIKDANELKEKLVNIDDHALFYLKSDYSKNPNYIYRFSKSNVPWKNIFWGSDKYLRNHYILQREFLGTHLRVNLYGDRFNVFKFDTGRITHDYKDALIYIKAISKLRDAMASYQLQNWLIKFDVILNEGRYVVLDIGMDPPLRMRQEALRQGFEFYELYLDQYLENRIAYPYSLD